MAISNTSSTTSSTSSSSSSLTSSSSSSSNSAIAGNFDQFLTLLTTQLKNQSPLDPLDTNQFTAQLVQFAGVEQQLKMNDTLSALLTLNKANATTDAVGFIGSTITADGAATPLKNGSAIWQVNASAAGSAKVTIKNSSGSVVQTLSTSVKSGDQTFSWDGTTSTGTKAADGDYTITVDGTDLSGKALTVKTEVIGVVDGVDLSGTTPALKIGAISVAIDKVKRVVKAQ
jgi:flagellar basal-body rod modification protein FlgD